MNRSIRRISLLLTAGLLGACGPKPSDQHAMGKALPTVVVRTQAVESKKWPATEEVVGNLRAKLHSTVEARVSGRILQMPCVLGRKVARGQLLVKLDAAEMKARLEQAQAGLQQAERDWKRVSSLLAQQAATRSDYDAANSHYLAATAMVAEAQAMMAYVEVLAPFDGVVTRKAAEVGDLAAPGKPLLELEDASSLQLEADVPESLAAGIQESARMSLRVEALPDEIRGTVVETAPAADPVSRTFRVKLDVPFHPQLRPGQFARLLVPRGESVSMRVPSSAVLQRGQMDVVFVVENQRARLHLVRIGRSAHDETEILSGLEANDAVITDGVAQLVDGQPVSVP